MLKPLALAIAICALGLHAGHAAALNLSLPGSAIASTALADTDASIVAREDTGGGGTARANTPDDANRQHPQADTSGEARTDATHGAVGADGVSGADAQKVHRRGHWQSLLPGVMK